MHALCLLRLLYVINIPVASCVHVYRDKISTLSVTPSTMYPPTTIIRSSGRVTAKNSDRLFLI